MTLKEIRDMKGMGQTEMDDFVGLPRGTTHDIETGRNANPSWKIVSQYCQKLGMKPEKLFPVEIETEKTA